jgi:ribulose-phosphate 3-epimerase
VTNPISIAPSILAADFTRLGEQVREAEAGGAALIHIDVMDGQFVPNISMGPLVVEAVRRVTALPLDVHLMIITPDRLLESFASAGANAITVHWEACPDLPRTLEAIKQLGCRPGIAINPPTSADVLSEFVGRVEVINVMTVNPGFGGQALLPETLPKIRQVREMIGTRAIDLEVDGGINTETTPTIVEAGANVLVAGSSVFNTKHSVREGIKALLRAAGN